MAAAIVIDLTNLNSARGFILQGDAAGDLERVAFNSNHSLRP